MLVSHTAIRFQLALFWSTNFKSLIPNGRKSLPKLSVEPRVFLLHSCFLRIAPGLFLVASRGN